MPKLGEYDYPDSDVSQVIETAKKIAQQYGTSTFGRQALSVTLEARSANSGAFNQKLADMRRFGVLQGRGEDMAATDLAQRLAVPENPEAYAAYVRELVFKIPLYQTLYGKYPVAAPGESELLATLLSLTKAERTEVQKQLARIRNLYADALKELRAGGGVLAPPPPLRNQSDRGRILKGEVESEMIELRAGPDHHAFPFTPKGIAQMARLCDKSYWEYLTELATQAQAETKEAE